MSSTPKRPETRESERYERWSARLQWPLLGAALLSIPAIIIETTESSDSLQSAALLMDWVIWVAFASEFFALVYLSNDRWAWIRRHPLDVAIVLLTPPFLPPPLQALRVLRLLRVIRLIRLVSLARELFSLDGLRYAALVLVVIVLAGGVAFAGAEHQNQPGLTDWDGIWWAMTTVTTVGYGTPEVTTDAGRIIAIVIMAAGIGFVSLVTGAMAQKFGRATQQEANKDELILAELKAIRERLDMLDNTSRSVE